MYVSTVCMDFINNHDSLTCTFRQFVAQMTVKASRPRLNFRDFNIFAQCFLFFFFNFYSNFELARTGGVYEIIVFVIVFFVKV